MECVDLLGITVALGAAFTKNRGVGFTEEWYAVYRREARKSYSDTF